MFSGRTYSHVLLPSEVVEKTNIYKYRRTTFVDTEVSYSLLLIVLDEFGACSHRVLLLFVQLVIHSANTLLAILAQ